MAEEALRNIPTKDLKDVLKHASLRTLIGKPKGCEFFEIYLKHPKNSHTEFLKYWDFLYTVALIKNLKDVNQKLDYSDNCFKKYIAIEADCEHSIMSLINRAKVKDIDKALKNHRLNHSDPKDTFSELEILAFEYLDEKMFIPILLGVLKEENERRGDNCAMGTYCGSLKCPNPTKVFE